MYENEIFIDYDNQNIKKFLKDFRTIKEMLKHILNIKIKITKICKTINGYHIYAKVTHSYKLNKKELFLFLNSLELILNSDNKRAIFNLLRILMNFKNYKNISVLFRDTEIKKIKVKL